jgi:hypothetical protein
MYSGFGGKTDPNAKKSLHILNSESLRGESTQRQEAPKENLHKDVMAFERKLQYDNLVRAGVNPVNAIRQVVPKVKSGVALTPQDIANIIETGEVKKSRVG